MTEYQLEDELDEKSQESLVDGRGMWHRLDKQPDDITPARIYTLLLKPILMSQNPEVNELRFPVSLPKCFPPGFLCRRKTEEQPHLVFQVANFWKTEPLFFRK